MSEKIQSIIVDDETNNIDLLKHFLNQYCPNIEIIATSTSREEGVNIIKKLKPQLLFLDIMLDEGTGFDLLEEVTYSETKVIFVTAFDEYAVKAFKFNAVDYVLKPIDIDELVTAVEKASLDINKDIYTDTRQIQNSYKSITNNEATQDIIAIPSTDRIDFIKVEDIFYLKSEGRYSIFNFEDKNQIVATKNLGEYESILDGNSFFRIHHSYIVNLKKLKGINKSGGNYCELFNGESLPIAKRRQDQLHRFLGLK